ncbi:MAG: hypothetical protein VXW43_05455 [Pseudomonadota bacterium]|nr:hypothetical protein [Pseudomonadota bacterium]
MSAFSVYLSAHRAKALGLVPQGVGFTCFFGGPHLGLPSFRRAKVQPGDRLYPVSVAGGQLLLLGAATVETISDEPDIHPRDFAPHLDMAVTERWIARSGWPAPAFFGALCPTCATEALTLTDSLGPFRPRPLPAADLEAFTFLNARGTRRPDGVTDGKITKPLAFQGIYRLAPHSAAALASLAQD